MSSSSESKLATAKTILSTVGSIAATALVVRSVANDLLPQELYDYIVCGIQNLFSTFSNSLTMVIPEYDGLDINEIYKAAEIYLGTKDSPKACRLMISRPEKEKHSKITIGKNQVIPDTYGGQKFKWDWICGKREIDNSHLLRNVDSTTYVPDVRSFELTFHKKNRDLVINSYLPHIVNEARNKKHEKKTIKIYTRHYHLWTPVTFDHPATFETLAMDSDQKGMIMNDLEKFVGRKEYYRKVGKAWKRGYLLHGPPGTGKSSLIAAMANYLNFDVYDLELTQVKHNYELRNMLVETGNKSILVIEDIDCTVDLQEKLTNRDDSRSESHRDREGKSTVTLSGLLNFVDGLWSSCGDERIIVFTTNYMEKLDPALLRPGRMDVHINMSYCTPGGFRVLASNYLGIKEHALFDEIEGSIGNAKTTPAEVAEVLLKNGDDPDVALTGLIHFIRKKIYMNTNNYEKDE